MKLCMAYYFTALLTTEAETRTVEQVSRENSQELKIISYLGPYDIIIFKQKD